MDLSYSVIAHLLTTQPSGCIAQILTNGISTPARLRQHHSSTNQSRTTLQKTSVHLSFFGWIGDTCLGELFYEVRDIQDQALLLGKILGAVARIYQAIDTCEVDIDGLSCTYFVNFQSWGYGESFVNGICALLAEMSSSESFLEGAKQAFILSVAENVAAIKKSIKQLKANCLCLICNRKQV